MSFKKEKIIFEIYKDYKHLLGFSLEDAPLRYGFHGPRILDIFGAKPRFLIDGFKSQRSYIGAFFSVIFFLCVFLFFTYYFHQILSHSKPIMVVSNLIDEVPEKYSLNNDFMFVISLQYPNYTNFINYSDAMNRETVKIISEKPRVQNMNSDIINYI